jgi:hypothetical protein
MNTNDLSIPEKSAGDNVNALVRAGLGAIPIAGSAAVELFSSLITPPLESRRNIWMQEIANRITSLEKEKVIDISKLSKNDNFITIMMHASQIAIRNHANEKLNALRNAVLNSALPAPPEESKQLLFLNYIDDLTVWHLRVLVLFHDSRKWFKINEKNEPTFAITSNYEQLLLAAYPELRGNDELFDIIDKELANKGLFSSTGLRPMMSRDAAFQKRTTTLGDQFIKYIS